MLGLHRHTDEAATALLSSRLYNDQTFYKALLQDLTCSKEEVIIECPFLTIRRTTLLLPKLKNAIGRGVKVVVNTRHPLEHDDHMRVEAIESITILQAANVKVLYTGGHHRKLAIIDRTILYEGSLNILSQSDSCEVMRRIESEQLADEMMRFLRLEKFLD